MTTLAKTAIALMLILSAAACSPTNGASARSSYSGQGTYYSESLLDD